MANGKPTMTKKPEPAPASSGGSGDSKLIAALTYILWPWVSLFVMFTDKKSDKFALFHSYQALLFGGASFVVFFAFMVITTVISIVSGGLGGILGCLTLPLALVIMVAALFTAYKAYQGERYMLPMIGEMASKYAA